MRGKTKYIVKLSLSERTMLEKLIKTGKVAASKRQRAQILLYADEGPNGSFLKDAEIVRRMSVSLKTVFRTRQRLAEKGLETSLERVKRRIGPNPKKLDAGQEAKLVSLACIDPPEGYARWSLRLLSERMVSLEYVDSISYETVRRVLKKKKLNLGNERNGA